MVETQEQPMAGKILANACSLFAEKGYEATSTREICELSGITKPMLYYYFDSKEGLFRRVVTHYLAQFHERLAKAVASSDDPKEQLVELAWGYFDFCLDNTGFARLFYAIFFGPESQPLFAQLKEEAVRSQQHVFEAANHAAEKGLIRPESAGDFVMALQGMVNIGAMAMLKGDLDLDRSLAERMVQNLLQGFGRA